VTAGIYLAAYPLLRHVGLSPALASLAAYLLAILFQYLGHAVFTFRRTTRNAGQIARFLANNALGCALAAGAMAVLPGFGIGETAATVIVVCLLPVLNWFLMRFWVYA
jgi:putative flippase GtrA